MVIAEFNEKCYQVLKKVPKGKVTTYKNIAKALKTRAYRAVGRAMKMNENAPAVPCHRVVCSDGNVGGYLGKRDNEKKIKLLKKEGIEIVNGKINLEKFGFRV